MIAVDTNILVYAHRRDSVWHQPAAACLRRLAESNAAWMIPFPCLHEFLAASTNPRVYKPASTLPEVIFQIESWQASPMLVMGHESRQHWMTLCRILQAGKAAGGMVHDARIAAICIDHGVSVLWTADRDFARFPDLRTANPLIGQTA